jgi:hypothetical protein
VRLPRQFVGLVRLLVQAVPDPYEGGEGVDNEDATEVW